MTYADDPVILCKRGKADEALLKLREIMSKLKLTVNRTTRQVLSRGPNPQLDDRSHRMPPIAVRHCAAINCRSQLHFHRMPLAMS
ncbi:hypothetical protein [Paraburkholderia rhynchosiae]|uniref:Reverse transcriptase domain-containing protein n=1 Tax=Paraburkholderia rhynchosiae TaxID=487049 RepID=A0ABX4V322_9BURK|nr:hypothetical protein [Paraburkholderia rhynchosiae]PMS29460.1 hypothetical protein C0Z16_17940 [Paraburkholderia rhynchosiae]